MSDFPLQTDWMFILECVIKIAASIVCGFVLGIERKSHNQFVGARTLVLISVSSTLLSILSYYMAEQGIRRGYTGGDPTRIVAGVVSGIGFLGGGAIIRQGLNIKGLTSAAIIWTSSALGLALGAGLYIQSAVILIAVVLLLFLLEKVEERFFPAGIIKTLTLVYSDESINVAGIRDEIKKSGMIVSDLNVSRNFSEHRLTLRISVKTPMVMTYTPLMEGLKDIGPLEEFSISD